MTMMRSTLWFLLTAILGSTVNAHNGHHHNHDHEHHNHDEHTTTNTHFNHRRTLEQTYGKRGQYQTMGAWTKSSDFRQSGARCGAEGDENAIQKANQAHAKFLQEHGCPDDEHCPYYAKLKVGHSFRTIGVHWHNVQTDEGTDAAGETVILDAMDVLNSAFVGTGFQFKLLSNTTTKNTQYWGADKGTTGEYNMKNELRRGNCTELNIYSTGISRLLGWASWPWECSDAMWNDGVVVNYNTMPGGLAFPYNEGDTLTHEVGHWLGLFHTFEGGCGENGDFVADTPAEAYPDYECEQGRDSCGDGGWADDVSNYLNYGPDSCMNHFSIGQVGRMHSAVTAYRRQ